MTVSGPPDVSYDFGRWWRAARGLVGQPPGSLLFAFAANRQRRSDYLWITSMGSFSFATWTDWRNTVRGTDRREAVATRMVVRPMCSSVVPLLPRVNAWSGD